MTSEINTSAYEKLSLAFYQNEDVVDVARSLLGKYLFSQIDGKLAGGKIVETEAYCGRGDKACHANGKITPRTSVMYQEGGVAYVYLCYGIHHLINVVTNKEGMADAVLIRALEPLIGIEIMKQRRNHAKKLTSGPGTLTQALGIKTSLTGESLIGDQIWISELEKTDLVIKSGTRIGVDYAGEDALRPWRFVINKNPFVSKKIDG
jgi:DNA-3-methyladenine glycosylase